MSWSEQNALKKVVSVFKRSKERNVPIYDNDIEAIKTLNTALEIKSKDYVNDNKLFLKLVCVILKERSEHYGSIKIAIKSLDDDLKYSVRENIGLLKMSLNHTETIFYLKSIGYNLELFDHTKETKYNNETILKDKEKEIIDKLKTSWSFENIEKSLYNTANDFLKNIDYYR